MAASINLFIQCAFALSGAPVLQGVSLQRNQWLRQEMGRNESVFREIQPDTRIVIEHVVKPWYRLTVTLTARGDKTHLAWVQEFESPEVAAKMRRLSDTANEQKRAEVEINGGCWMEIARRPPCSEGAAEYQGKCYVGVGAAIRSPTSIGP